MRTGSTPAKVEPAKTALVGYDDSGATHQATMERLLWGAAKDKSPVRKVRGRLPER
jgi:hypothetical protein